MFVVSLGSGSSGNATLIRTANGESVLLDCGVPSARLLAHLRALHIAPASLRAIVLTHLHSDHTQSAALLHNRYGVPVCVGPVAHRTHMLTNVAPSVFPSDRPFMIGEMRWVPHAVPHDATETFGFVVEADGCNVAVFTDLGSDHGEITTAIGTADLVMIEANYDREMLRNSRYPAFLKTRIGGRNGHLSNDACASLLARAFTTDRPRDIWLAHLSAENNTPEHATETVTTALRAVGLTHMRVAALPRHERGPIWSAVRHRQLPLFGTD